VCDITQSVREMTYFPK